MNEMLHDLAANAIRVSIFDTADEASVLVSDHDLIDSLKSELAKIE